MSDTSNIKPWFRDDLAKVFVGIYLASLSHGSQKENSEFHSGFASALSSVAIIVGINPESFLVGDDLAKIIELGQARLNR